MMDMSEIQTFNVQEVDYKIILLHLSWYIAWFELYLILLILLFEQYLAADLTTIVLELTLVCNKTAYLHAHQLWLTVETARYAMV